MFRKDGFCAVYRAFHTTRESHQEVQPHVGGRGVVITWDGRLDNRVELIRDLRSGLDASATDVAIVAAAFEKWGVECLSRLNGDWAASIWDPNDRSLLLAKDVIGVHNLYYSLSNNKISWSTVLDPLVLSSERRLEIDEEYLAGWLVFSPATHLSPYVGIQSVPPSSYVLIRNAKVVVRKYWDFDPNKQIRYRSDAEYEEQFRKMFAESVRRRLRSDTPVLSELSGGMDSSSIVCVADSLIANGVADTPRLDTVSFYNDSEPNWNERPYFLEVEKKRGRPGFHIDAGLQSISNFGLDAGQFSAIPGSLRPRSEFTNQFAVCMRSQGNRVVLSGTGGDEVTGGVPTPMPELADLLLRARFGLFAHKLKVWALEKRQPWFHLFFETIRDFLPQSIVGVAEYRRPASWLSPRFVNKHRTALSGYEGRLRIFGGLPSFQANLDALNGLRGQLGSFSYSSPPYEKRYPYLDRDLLEFLYAIPREQFVRPGQRRSLMRRAMAGIVPDAILHRRRKAFVSRTPLATLKQDWDYLVEMSHNMLSEQIAIIDSQQFLSAIQDACIGKEQSLTSILRTLVLESWLRGLSTLEHRPFDWIRRPESHLLRAEQRLVEPYKSLAS
jgi:asparagine synthase (glutamine-hydrolysing)